MRHTGLYVHVPFCRQLCPYCDFAVAVRADPPHEQYCDALLRELEVRSDELGPLHTVYFGGGTPAMWSVPALTRFLSHVDVTPAIELTIEANPHDITAETLDAWASAGINRVSLGVQSFDGGLLAGLGRDHDGETARTAVERLVSHGAFRSSVDLIYSGPGYGPGMAERDAQVVAALGVNHVSAYELTVEPRTVFARRQEAGTLGLASDEAREDWGFEMVESLARNGFERYEVSSFGRDHDVAEHNSGYWLGRDYVGIGTGAHSFRGLDGGRAERRANPRGLKEYLRGDPGELDIVSLIDHLGERLFLTARTTLGVRWSELEARFGRAAPDAWQAANVTVQQMVEKGWLYSDDDKVGATRIGLDFGDVVAQCFWHAVHSA